MGRDDEFRPLRPDGDQGQADQRRPGGVELVGPVLGEEPVERRVRIGFTVAGQVDVPPGQGDVFGHDLHRIAAGSGEERGAQVGVPVEQGLSGGPHARGVHVPGQMQHELHVVDVEGAVGERGLEQDPELARGLRPHLDQWAVARLPGLDLVLPYGDERGVRGCQSADLRLYRVRGHAVQQLDPQRGQFGGPLTGQHPGGEHEGRLEAGAVGGVRDGRSDLQRGERRQVRVGCREQLGRPGGRSPSVCAQVFGHVGVGDPAQVVEPDLGAGRSASCTAVSGLRWRSSPYPTPLSGIPRRPPP